MTEIEFQRLAWERLSWEPGFLPFRFNCGKLKNGYSDAVYWGPARDSDGVADLGVQLPDGIFAWIELKQPGKRLSPPQQKFAAAIEAAGGLYLTATNMEDVEGVVALLRQVVAGRVED